MNLIEINERIGYIAQNHNPLSADIGVIKRQDSTWLFDVGNGPQNIDGLDKTYNIVLSHFHLDHIGNIANLKINKIYASKETYKHLPISVRDNCEIVIVENDINVDGLHIFPIISSHCKGSVGLEIDEEYAFLGDAIYCKYLNGKQTYNVQLLKSEIETLKSIKAQYFLVSHYRGLIRNKEEVINELEIIYQKRIPKENVIVLGEPND